MAANNLVAACKIVSLFDMVFTAAWFILIIYRSIGRKYGYYLSLRRLYVKDFFKAGGE
jgi:hypothetical protein